MHVGNDCSVFESSEKIFWESDLPWRIMQRSFKQHKSETLQTPNHYPNNLGEPSDFGGIRFCVTL